MNESSVKEKSKLKDKNTCRVCLAVITGKSLSLFEQFKDHFVYTYIHSISSVRINKNDGYPNKICKDCLLELETAVQFKEKCETSDKFLHSTLTSKNVDISLDIKKEESEKDEDVELKRELDEESCISTTEYPNVEMVAVDSSDFTLDIEYSEKTQFQCYDCGEYFRTKCKLRVHWKKMHYAQSCIRVCPRCRLSFKSLKAYQNHMEKVTKTCIALGDELIRIEGEGKNRIFYCKECEYKSTYLANIIHHCARHSGKRQYQCKLCPRGFIQYASMSKHMEYTHKQFKHIMTCHFCGKLIKGIDTINRHLKTHTSERKFQCDICKKSYKTKFSLVNHLQTHKEKTFTCEICAKVFHTASGLWIHIQYVHNKHKQKLIKCSICEYRTLKTYNIKKHERKHTDNNIACPQCGMFFEKAEKMLKHQRIHFEEKKFACSACDRKYLALDSLHKHQKAAHGMKFS